VTTWPIRLRITLGFTLAMALLLTVVGLAAYQGLAAGLSDDLDRELQQRAQDLTLPVRRPGSSLTDVAGTGFIERGESFAQVVGTDGSVLQSTVTLHSEPLLSEAEVTRAARRTIFLARAQVPGLDEPARLLATPVLGPRGHVILVVGLTRENGRETLHRVRLELVLGLPVLLLLTSLLGYLLAGAALRPVEAMRRRAAEMSGAAAGQRLPRLPGDDQLARLGATLNELLDRVDTTLVRQRTFVANASHELRTPLALVRTELELALRRPRSVAELTGAIGSAAEEVDRLIRLAEELLLLASADDDGLRIAPERLDVATLLSGVASRFQSLADRTGRAVTVTTGAVGEVEADAPRLEQALVNLVGNAFQHGAGAVELSARTVGAETEFRVTDTGDGFSALMLAQGFERFVHHPGSSGRGLGLSIVASVAAAHGGHCGLDNRPTGGSAVWIRLPTVLPSLGAALSTSVTEPLRWCEAQTQPGVTVRVGVPRHRRSRRL
jgi:two-component system OmpR family sensor kinase